MDERSRWEENPFEDETVAKEWITSVENERDRSRDREVYPYLKKWVGSVAPETIVEIGSGQGICCEKIEFDNASYIGIEPSAPLVGRAKELYSKPHRQFIVGNAYALPVASASTDVAFSLNVWFHLKDLPKASAELARILNVKGQFCIITANPKVYETWESFFFNHQKEGKLVRGAVKVPVNPLSDNTMYEHTLDELTGALEGRGLGVVSVDELGFAEEVQAKLFVGIKGHKIRNF